LVQPIAYHQTACLQAGVLVARTEGVVPAPETSHAIKAVIDEALRCKREGKSEVILFNFSGHGHFDMQAYMDLFGGKVADTEIDPAALQAALAALPAVGN
jgi:tryptophan synthase beta chain